MSLAPAGGSEESGQEYEEAENGDDVDLDDRPAKKLKPEKAHFGMSTKPKKQTAMTVAEQEELALKLLAGG